MKIGISSLQTREEETVHGEEEKRDTLASTPRGRKTPPQTTSTQRLPLRTQLRGKTFLHNLHCLSVVHLTLPLLGNLVSLGKGRAKKLLLNSLKTEMNSHQLQRFSSLLTGRWHLQNTIGVATGIRARRCGPRRGEEILFLFKRPEGLWGPPGCLFSNFQHSVSEVKQRRPKVDHSHPSICEVKNKTNYTSFPPIRFHGVNRKHFTLFTCFI